MAEERGGGREGETRALSFEYLDWKGRQEGWRFAGKRGGAWVDGGGRSTGRNLGPLNRVFREIYEIRTDKVGNKSRAETGERREKIGGRRRKKEREKGRRIAARA